MEIIIIALLILVGAMLMVAEIFLLPGITIAAILSLCSFSVSLYFSYEYYGLTGFIISTIVSFALLVALFIVFFRKKALSRLSLEETIDSKSSENASEKLKIGDSGVSKTRLNPMGTVFINGELFEAKSFDGYVDAKQNVGVIGFEDSVIIVKVLK